MSLTVKCNECGFESDVGCEPAPNSCLVCSSIYLSRYISVVASPVSIGSIHDSVTVRVKNPDLPSKKKLRKEIQAGADLYRKTGEYLDKYRLIDKDNDRYVEIVKDLSTGKVTYHCNEPLSAHTGHGSARKPLASEEQQSSL